MPKVYFDSNPLTAHQRVYVDSNKLTAHEYVYVVENPLLAEKRVYLDPNPLTADRRVFIVDSPLLAGYNSSVTATGAGGIPTYRPEYERGFLASAWRAFVVIAGVALGASLVATPWAATTFQTSSDARPYRHGLTFLLHVSATAAGAAIAASWVYAAAARSSRSYTDVFSRQRPFSLLLGVVPPVVVFLVAALSDHNGSMWQSVGGSAFGPPRWFWVLGPCGLAIGHVMGLVAAAGCFRRDDRPRVYPLLIIAAAVSAAIAVFLLS